MEAPNSGSEMMQGTQSQTVGSNNLHPARPQGTPQTMGLNRLDPARPEMMQGTQAQAIRPNSTNPAGPHGMQGSQPQSGQPQIMGSNSLEPARPHGSDGTAGADTNKSPRSAASRCHVLKLDKYNDQGANNEVLTKHHFVILLIRKLENFSQLFMVLSKRQRNVTWYQLNKSPCSLIKLLKLLQ